MYDYNRNENTRNQIFHMILWHVYWRQRASQCNFTTKKEKKKNVFARTIAEIVMQMTHSVGTYIYEFRMIFKF